MPGTVELMLPHPEDAVVALEQCLFIVGSLELSNKPPPREGKEHPEMKAIGTTGKTMPTHKGPG